MQSEFNATQRKGRKRKRLLDQSSPFVGLDFQAQILLASWRLGVLALNPHGMESRANKGAKLNVSA
jgi:hypothetical protein